MSYKSAIKIRKENIAYLKKRIKEEEGNDAQIEKFKNSIKKNQKMIRALKRKEEASKSKSSKAKKTSNPTDEED